MTVQFEIVQSEIVASKMSSALGRAFHTALLLTGNLLSAERAVALAIDSLEPEGCTAEGCLLRTIEKSIRCFEPSGAQAEIALADGWPGLPIELRRVIQMKAALRHSFVLRVLLGFSEEYAARLLQLQPREVRVRSSEAVRWLAGTLETAPGFLASDRAPWIPGASIPADVVRS